MGLDASPRVLSWAACDGRRGASCAGLSMDHEQFVREYRGGRGLSAGEVLVALGIGFGLWHLLRAIDRVGQNRQPIDV
jgi:hypothetical protein